MDMVNNMKYLGLDISKELKNNRKAPIKQRQLEDVYDISRYQPVVKLMLDVSTNMTKHYIGLTHICFCRTT